MQLHPERACRRANVSRGDSARAGLLKLMSSANVVAVGMISCSASRRFGATSTLKVVTPVRLPPGRLRLATRPNLTGSPAVTKTIGIVAVAALAASAAGVVVAAITVTFRRTKSAANSGSRSLCPSAQRYSIETFRPSMYPASFTPCRNAAILDAYPPGELLWRNPTTSRQNCGDPVSVVLPNNAYAGVNLMIGRPQRNR